MTLSGKLQNFNVFALTPTYTLPFCDQISIIFSSKLNETLSIFFLIIKIHQVYHLKPNLISLKDRIYNIPKNMVIIQYGLIKIKLDTYNHGLILDCWNHLV